MYPTVEVRWFFRGRLPASVAGWFASLAGPVSSAESRVDHYLRLDGAEAVGVKFREGNIEVKRRAQALGQVSFPNGVRGHLEHWRKWSFAVADDSGAAGSAFVKDGDWLAVSKTRQLRGYRVQEGRLLALPSSEDGHGCEVELAQVTRASSWWSVALEAFGPEEQLRRTLEDVGERLFAGPLPVALTAETSFSYPQWLALPTAT